MEPSDALRSIETALRLVIRDVLGPTEWLRAPGAPDEAKLQERRAEEDRRRDGAVVSNNLLDYTETYHLTGLIEENWEKFQPVFKDKTRTLAYFGVIKDVRNSVAHSRDLVPFERDLISGVAGQLRNQVSLFRSAEQNPSSRYYPLIESVKDHFGREGAKEAIATIRRGPRLEVASVLTFTGSAFNARSNPVKWQVFGTLEGSSGIHGGEPLVAAEGDSISLDYIIAEKDVGEDFGLAVCITTNSQYHRYSGNMPFHAAFDDRRYFRYAVNPPEES
jgi:hypothetical protein